MTPYIYYDQICIYITTQIPINITWPHRTLAIIEHNIYIEPVLFGRGNK